MRIGQPVVFPIQLSVLVVENRGLHRPNQLAAVLQRKGGADQNGPPAIKVRQFLLFIEYRRPRPHDPEVAGGLLGQLRIGFEDVLPDKALVGQPVFLLGEHGGVFDGPMPVCDQNRIHTIVQSGHVVEPFPYHRHHLAGNHAPACSPPERSAGTPVFSILQLYHKMFRHTIPAAAAPPFSRTRLRYFISSRVVG